LEFFYTTESSIAPVLTFVAEDASPATLTTTRTRAAHVVTRTLAATLAAPEVATSAVCSVSAGWSVDETKNSNNNLCIISVNKLTSENVTLISIFKKKLNC